ncbi:MAG: precorrin-2 C(20)-methyltransferase [Actinobacteria bacterium]|nr:precorrin-2 C(20)-methyltransferase [Actinomycetota bacterium]
MTLKAVEAIRSAPVIAFPVHKEGATSRAYETVAAHIPAAAELLPLLMPMTRDLKRLEQAHADAAKAIAAAAAGGRDVVYLSLGDPLFYSTFGYLAERFAGPVEVISGVTAASATSAALGLPLADGDTPTVVVTGKAHQALAAALEMGASVIVIKPRSLTERSLDLLDESGAWPRACAAIELGGSGQKLIEELNRDIAAKLPYFAVIWIRPSSPAAGDKNNILAEDNQ